MRAAAAPRTALQHCRAAAARCCVGHRNRVASVKGLHTCEEVASRGTLKLVFSLFMNLFSGASSNFVLGFVLPRVSF